MMTTAEEKNKTVCW